MGICTKTTVAVMMLVGFWFASSQQQPIRIVPDCGPIFFTATTSGVPSAFTTATENNLTNGQQCSNWTLSYSSTGFSALSIQIEDAPDATGAPGSWVAFAGTVVSGSNPSTATTSASIQVTGFYPWMRVNVTSVTGSGKITGMIYGYHVPGSSSGGGAASFSTMSITNLPSSAGSGGLFVCVDSNGVLYKNSTCP